MDQLYVVGCTDRRHKRALRHRRSRLSAALDRAANDLIEGNTKLSATDSLAEVGGPALAGILVQTLTAPFAIAVNAATYLVSALFLGSITARRTAVGRTEKRRVTLLSDLRSATR